MNNRKKIEVEWRALLEQVGYKFDGLSNMDSQSPEVARLLGCALHDYMTAAIYDMDWEGFKPKDLSGIAHLMQDMSIAVCNGLLPTPTGDALIRQEGDAAKN